MSNKYNYKNQNNNTNPTSYENIISSEKPSVPHSINFNINKGLDNSNMKINKKKKDTVDRQTAGIATNNYFHMQNAQSMSNNYSYQNILNNRVHPPYVNQININEIRNNNSITTQNHTKRSTLSTNNYNPNMKATGSGFINRAKQSHDYKNFMDEFSQRIGGNK